MVAPTRFAVAAAAALALAAATARTGDAHPLHTTLAEVSVDAARRTVRATIRLFADDLAGATKARSATTEATAVAYVAGAFSLSEGGRAVELRSCGVKRAENLLWVCLEGTAASAVSELHARDVLFFETYKDQVNIVQVRDGADRQTVLFTPGDGAKRLR